MAVHKGWRLGQGFLSCLAKLPFYRLQSVDIALLGPRVVPGFQPKSTYLSHHIRFSIRTFQSLFQTLVVNLEADCIVLQFLEHPHLEQLGEKHYSFVVFVRNFVGSLPEVIAGLKRNQPDQVGDVREELSLELKKYRLAAFSRTASGSPQAKSPQKRNGDL